MNSNDEIFQFTEGSLIKRNSEMKPKKKQIKS